MFETKHNFWHNDSVNEKQSVYLVNHSKRLVSDFKHSTKYLHALRNCLHNYLLKNCTYAEYVTYRCTCCSIYQTQSLRCMFACLLHLRKRKQLMKRNSLEFYLCSNGKNTGLVSFWLSSII